MKTLNNDNQFATVATVFGLIGLALLLSVMVWHQEINQHPAFRKTAVVETPTVQPKMQVAAVSQPVVDTKTVPDSIIQEITQDPRNLLGAPLKTDESLSPALKFLYTLNAPQLFPNQR